MKRRDDLEIKVLEFLYKWFRPIRIGDLRKELLQEKINIPHSSLNSIVLRLEKEGFVSWEKYGAVKLTQEGQQKAAHQQRHFHLLVMFLMDTLGLSHEDARKESYRISSLISCNLIEAMNQRLNNPVKCQCDAAIPIVEGCAINESVEEL
ncbi:MAG TPA: iron dependent repressor, metal binding and dimerization domain protein [Candidatus Glassbacteria bacterium]|nr:iron dependent repressor, metal binding and dimerization domain protein [Candidatus Glassbacteria bacterium]